MRIRHYGPSYGIAIEIAGETLAGLFSSQCIESGISQELLKAASEGGWVEAECSNEEAQLRALKSAVPSCEGGGHNYCGKIANYTCSACNREVCFDHIHRFLGSMIGGGPLCSRCNFRRLAAQPRCDPVRPRKPHVSAAEAHDRAVEIAKTRPKLSGVLSMQKLDAKCMEA